ncbi:MAG: response regulator [Promethearchaeia archaeon]
MARINLVVSDETKEKWELFKENSEISTLSKLIRTSVEQFIESNFHENEIEKFQNYSHNIKEELTLIKSYAQLLIKDLKEKLDFNDLKKLHSIYQKSVNVENIINAIQKPKLEEKENVDVLIIDDNPDYITLVSDIIKKKDLSFRATQSGRETLELLKNITPKLILLDIFLPDMSGYDIYEEIRKDDKLQEIPVYFITAVPEEEVAEMTKKVGAEGYLTKGFEIEEFNRLISEII